MWPRLCLFSFIGLFLLHDSARSELLIPDKAVSAAIDHYIDAALRDNGISPAAVADDMELVRRTTLDLVGRIPTVHEAKTYIESTDSRKHEQLVDDLLASPGHIRHQVNEFDALLMQGTGTNLREYLQVALGGHRPWNQMFREMIQGIDKAPIQQNPDRFVKARVTDLDKLANDTSVLFFGINVSCAQCHDHPLVPEWTQDHFFGMKSFFNRTFENGDFVGEREYGLVQFKTAEGEDRTAKMMFLTGTVIEEAVPGEPSDKEKEEERELLEQLKEDNKPPPLPRFSRRAQLVEIATRDGENQVLARAIINRLWYRLYGYGLVMPVDQMHPENSPSHPELLEWLARELISHHFDLRPLVRGMVLSRSYARSSRWEEGERPHESHFAVAAVRALTPHQYATSMRVATANPDQFSSDVKSESFDQQIQSLENAAWEWVDIFEHPRGDFQVSVSEALVLTNSERVMNELLPDTADTLVGKLKQFENNQELVEMATWNVLSRPPDETETEMLATYLSVRADRRTEAIQQVVWALLASGESRVNH